MRIHCGGMKSIIWVILAVVMAACASMGRPEGGARDENPPVFVKSDPAPGETNVSKTRITAYFDENIQLEDAFTKVVVSPAQNTPPQISANGRRLTVDFRDTLIPDVTYTIDFADAIKDLNEGNILDGFALDFSTGNQIDTLRISGMVLQARNLEPAQGMLVGVYSNLSDTAISTLPLERIARTNQYGQFTIRNLKPGAYKIFAVNDMNRDYHWDRSEDVAFFDSIIVPEIETITITDTLYASDRSDSLVQRTGLKYLPNDILLSWFNQNYKAHYLKDYKREDRRKISLKFGAPLDSLPQVKIVDGADSIGADISKWALLNANETLDSLIYWIKDPNVLDADSLRLSVRYQKNDSVDNLVWTTDTLRFYYRDLEKKKKDKKKKDQDNEPKFYIDSITGDTTFLPPPDMEYLEIKIENAIQDVHKPLVLEFSTPLEKLDSADVKISIQKDTLWIPLKTPHLIPDSTDRLMRRRINMKWEPGEKYRIEIDTLRANSIYNTWNRPFAQEFTVKPLEDYCNLSLTIEGLDSLQAVVELLSSNDETVATAIKRADSQKADFKFLDPGTFYLRLFIDSNLNGKWDTGNLTDSIQPEEIYYFAKKLDLKKNWDIEQTWIVDELPVDRQKPYAIKKNKPKLKRGEKAPEEELENEEDDFYDPFGSGINNRPGSNNNRRGAGGLRKANTGSRAR